LITALFLLRINSFPAPASIIFFEMGLLAFSPGLVAGTPKEIKPTRLKQLTWRNSIAR
jgi:hypothetical protein